MYEISRLKNGVVVATAEMPHMASTSLGMWVSVGGRYEPAPANGMCHFIEHMLFKGTQKRTAREISAAVEGIGGYLNAFTGEESTCFYARASHEQFAHVLDVIMDMFLNSRFTAEDIEKERNVIKEEIAMYLDQPHQHVQELLNETMWPTHPLGRPLTGTAETLDGLLVAAKLCGEQFQRDPAPERQVFSQIHDSHATAAEQRLDSIVADDVAWLHVRLFGEYNLRLPVRLTPPMEPSG